MPVVSVITVSHNRPSLLRRSISSALSQTFTDYELIIVDDSSGDECEEVVGSFGDARIQFVKVKPPITAAAAENVGIGLAKGRYVAFLDDDDEWLPQKLSRQLEVFAKSGDSVGLVYSGFEYVDEVKGYSKPMPATIRGRVFDRLLEGCFIWANSSVMVRADVLAEVGGFDEVMTSIHDWDLYLKIAIKYEFDFAPEVLVKYYCNYGGLTRNVESRLQAQGIAFGRYLKFIKSNRVLAYFYFRRGVLLNLGGRSTEGRRSLFQSLRINPRSPRTILLLCLSLLGSGAFTKIYYTFEGSSFGNMLIRVSAH